MKRTNKLKKEILKKYDVFIGREILENGDEYFVTLYLHNGGSISYCSLWQACDDLCAAIKRGERVLLHESPGEVGPKAGRTSELLDIVYSALLEVAKEEYTIRIDKNGEEDRYFIMGRRYEPFTLDQMLRLKQMYESRPDMKNFPNPFFFLDSPNLLIH